MYDWSLSTFHTLVMELGKPWNYGLDKGQTRAIMETRGKTS
jgi:hypothetical protein